MKVIAVAALAYVLIALQGVVERYVGGGWLPLALALPCVVALGQNAGNVEGAVGAAAVGYLMDLAAGGPKGLCTFLAVLLFLAVRVLAASVDVRSLVSQMLVSALGTAFFGMGALVLIRMVAPPEAAPGGALFGRVLVEALLTGLASPPVLWAMKRIDGLFAREESGLLLR